MNDLIDETQKGRRAVDVAQENNKFDCVSMLGGSEVKEEEGSERSERNDEQEKQQGKERQEAEEREKIKSNDLINTLQLQLQKLQAENVSHLFVVFLSFSSLVCLFLLFLISRFQEVLRREVTDLDNEKDNQVLKYQSIKSPSTTCYLLI